MIVPGIIARQFALQRTYVEAVADRVRDNLAKYAEREGMPFLSRLKSVESLTEKLEGGRYTKWSDIDDLHACALVMPGLHTETAILAFLNDKFEAVAVRKRGSTLKDPAVFRFDATRFIGRLKIDAAMPADSPLRAVSFEVQLRTAFEHAWSAATHELTYKPDRIDWKRMRLSAQLKATVEQLDQLLVGFEQAADIVVEHRWPELDAQRAIEAFFRGRFASGSLPEELAPLSWGRFCENLYSLLISVSTAHVRNKEQFVIAKLNVIGAGLDALRTDRVPRSLTVTQLCLGLLAEGGAVSAPLARYTPLLTDDLLQLYPSVKSLMPGFDFGGSTSVSA